MGNGKGKNIFRFPKRTIQDWFFNFGNSQIYKLTSGIIILFR